MSGLGEDRLKIDARKKPRMPLTRPQGSRCRMGILLLLWRMSGSEDASFSSMSSKSSSTSLALSPDSGSLASGTCDSSGRNVTAGVHACSALSPALLDPIGDGCKPCGMPLCQVTADGMTAAFIGHAYGDACWVADMVAGGDGHGRGRDRARTGCAGTRRRGARGRPYTRRRRAEAGQLLRLGERHALRTERDARR